MRREGIGWGLCLVLLAVSGRAGSHGSGLDEAVAALEQALQERDFSRVEARLAPGFRYDGHGGELARTIMRQVVTGFPGGLERIEILDVQADDEVRRIRARLVGVGSGEIHELLLTEDGRWLEAEVAKIRLAGHDAPSGESRRAGRIELAETEVRIPFELRDDFPVPIVEVDLGDGRPRLFAVDTAAACSALIRQRVADELGLEAETTAAVSDAGGATRPAEMVTLPRIRTGGLSVRDVPTIAHTPSAEHAAAIPDDLDGILGLQLFESLLLTLDYPERELRLSEGRLEPGLGVVPLEPADGVLQVRLTVAGVEVPVLLDTGHQGTLTLPSAWEDRLPFEGPLTARGRTATVSSSYDHRGARLAGRLSVGQASFESPPVLLSDRGSLALIGGGLLRHVELTLDQATRLARFATDGRAQVRDVPFPQLAAAPGAPVH